MIIREWTPEDYPVLKSWWEAHGWNAVPLAALPQCGIIVEDDGVPKAAIFAYMDHSTPFAMIEWLITDPQSKSPMAIKHAIKGIMQIVKSFGRTHMMTSSSNALLIRMFERYGFQQTDSNMTHLIYTGGE
jgi:hypothetical protein